MTSVRMFYTVCVCVCVWEGGGERELDFAKIVIFRFVCQYVGLVVV